MSNRFVIVVQIASCYSTGGTWLLPGMEIATSK